MGPTVDQHISRADYAHQVVSAWEQYVAKAFPSMRITTVQLT